MIVILGLELVTGSFAMLPAALIARVVSLGRVIGNLTLVFAGNLIGGLLYAWMYAAVQTQFHHVPAAGPAALIVAAKATLVAKARSAPERKPRTSNWAAGRCRRNSSIVPVEPAPRDG
jgi:formate/nitrite transporter FocA (FNT family)